MSQITPDGLPIVDGERTTFLRAGSMDDLIEARPNSASNCMLALMAKRHHNVVDAFVLKSVIYLRFADNPHQWERYDIPSGVATQLRKANDRIAVEGLAPLNELRKELGTIEIQPLTPSRRRDYVVPGGSYRAAASPTPRPARTTQRQPNLRYRQVIARSM